MTLNEVIKEINKPNMTSIKKLINNISLEGFTQFFGRLTNREKYFRDVQSILINKFKENRNKDPNEKMDVTLGVMFGIADTIISNRDLCDPDEGFFIIEKLIAEPISILNEHFSQNNKVTKGDLTL